MIIESWSLLTAVCASVTGTAFIMGNGIAWLWKDLSAVALLFKWQIFFSLLNLIWKHKFSITSVIKLFIPFPELLSGAVTTWIFLLWLFFWQLLGKYWQAICCLIWNLLMNQCFLSNPHSNVTSEYELFTIQWFVVWITTIEFTT